MALVNRICDARDTFDDVLNELDAFAAPDENAQIYEVVNDESAHFEPLLTLFHCPGDRFTYEEFIKALMEVARGDP